jgi:hypothetical protein
MFEKDEFERWIIASHIIFEIFEGRYDAYPLAVRWVEEWFSYGNFTNEEADVDRISALIKNFDYKVYGVEGSLKEKISKQIKSLIEHHLKEGKHENVGFAISPYLFTWNFQRFKKYFDKREDFNLESYFESLGTFLKAKKGKLKNFRNKILMYDQIEKEKIKDIFHEVNDKLKQLGIGNNEPIGTIKLIHILAPNYFPLIDNKIAKVTGLTSRWKTLAEDSYLIWMESLKQWLQNYLEKINNLEKGLKSSILKLVDQGLYVMSSLNLQLRIKRLGLRGA